MSLPVRAMRRAIAACACLAPSLVIGAALDKNIQADAAQPPTLPAVPAEQSPALRALPASYAACSAQPGGTVEIDGSAVHTVVECSLQAPSDGFIIAIGSGSMSYVDAAYEAKGQIMIDGSGGNASDRWINVYPDAGDGTDKSIALSHYLPVTAGTRRIAFVASRSQGGKVRIFDPTLTAIFVPASAAQTVCGSATGTTFRSEGSGQSVVTSCQVTVAENSTAFAFASASMAYGQAPSEARVRLGLNGSPAAGSERWVDVYADDVDGTDESMATQQAFTLTPGTHTIQLYASRFAGSGIVTMYDPVLTVLAVPESAAAICAHQSSTMYTNPSHTPTIMRDCSVTSATPARALVFGSASIGMSPLPAGGAYEGVFRLTAGSGPLSTTDRWIDIESDSGDGSDRVLAVQWGGELDPGTHTFGLQGARYGGPGEVRAYNAAVHVLLMPSDRLFRADFELP